MFLKIGRSHRLVFCYLCRFFIILPPADSWPVLTPRCCIRLFSSVVSISLSLDARQFRSFSFLKAVLAVGCLIRLFHFIRSGLALYDPTAWRIRFSFDHCRFILHRSRFCSFRLTAAASRLCKQWSSMREVRSVGFGHFVSSRNPEGFANKRQQDGRRLAFCLLT